MIFHITIGKGLTIRKIYCIIRGLEIVLKRQDIMIFHKLIGGIGLISEAGIVGKVLFDLKFIIFDVGTALLLPSDSITFF